ncbi:MAG: DNA/RNA nuclease SfsA [Kofleriaceae bacterium]
MLAYSPPLVEGRLVSRYQRFFADVELLGGGVVTAHCPNPGSMKTCLALGGRVWVQRKTGGKLDWGWEVAEIDGALVSVNPTRTNALVAAALDADGIPELVGYPKRRREAEAGDSRLDFLLVRGARTKERCFVEVKTVTMAGDAPGLAIFPDSVTERGVRHLDELRALRKQGFRTVMLFVVARGGCTRMRPADAIDPAYGAALRAAASAGVEVLAYQAIPSVTGLAWGRRVAVELSKPR